MIEPIQHVASTMSDEERYRKMANFKPSSDENGVINLLSCYVHAGTKKKPLVLTGFESMKSQTLGGSFICTDVPAMKHPKLPFDQEWSLLKVIVMELII